MRPVEGIERPVCTACGFVHYLDPKLVVAVIVARDGKLLLGRRAMEPGRGLWSFPSGYVNRGEVVEEAAIREVKEETDLDVSIGRLVGLYSSPGDPVVLAVYEAQSARGTPRPGAELLEVAFFPLSDLPPLAFSRDSSIIQDWLRTREAMSDR